ncbi:MAG: MYXO-CTERM sorting domain-containing protein [Polyangia bacterium]
MTTGPLSGACSECTASNTTLCNPLEPQCLLDLGICGCASDQSCGAVDSGLICSGPGGLCQPGCAAAPRNGCPAGQSCAASGGAGQCTMPAPCASDNDCSAPLTHCETATGHCVGCLVDNDCPAPLVCDGTAHTCLECTPADRQNCGADLAGAQCLPGGRCGCTQDSDCGGTTSGRVCDPVSSRCVPGCRGTGGNACPAGEPCSSTTSDVGRCNTQPATDGGAGGAGGNTGNGAAGGAGGNTGQGGAGTDASAPDGGGGFGGMAGAGQGATGGSAGAGSGTGGQGGGAGTLADGGGTTGAGGSPTDGPGAPQDGSADGIGAVNPGGYIAGGGCDCSTTGDSAPLRLLAWAVVGALGWVRRRRPRR